MEFLPDSRNSWNSLSRFVPSSVGGPRSGSAKRWFGGRFRYKHQDSLLPAWYSQD